MIAHAKIVMDMDTFMMTHPRPLYMGRIEKLALKRSI